MQTKLIALAIAFGLTLSLGSVSKAEGIDENSISSRSVVPLPPRRMQGGSVYAIVTQAAQRHGVPHGLAHAVIKVESGYNCGARNRSGASGLGQLMPGTARSLGVRNVMSCAENANGAMAYLGRMYRASGGNMCQAATGYNSGSPRGCSAYGRKVLRLAGA